MSEFVLAKDRRILEVLHFWGKLQPTGQLSIFNTSELTHFNLPSFEKNMNFPSTEREGAKSWSVLFILSPRFCGSIQFPFWSLWLTYKSLPPFSLMEKSIKLSSGAMYGSNSYFSVLNGLPAFCGAENFKSPKIFHPQKDCQQS